MPTQQGISLGFVYGLLCAFYHVHAIRLARRQLSVLVEPNLGAARQKLRQPWPIIALAQLAIGVAGFSEGVGSLYTAALGHTDEITYVVNDVSWRPNHVHCYKHKFADVSWLQNFFGAPCLDLEYAPGTRFHYRGHSSWLGFEHDAIEIEPEHLPRH